MDQVTAVATGLQPLAAAGWAKMKPSPRQIKMRHGWAGSDSGLCLRWQTYSLTLPRELACWPFHVGDQPPSPQDAIQLIATRQQQQQLVMENQDLLAESPIRITTVAANAIHRQPPGQSASIITDKG